MVVYTNGNTFRFVAYDLNKKYVYILYLIDIYGKLSREIY
jgi:hypothetical protein